MKVRQPKGFTIHRQLRSGTLVASIKSKGRTGARARARAMFAQLGEARREYVLWAWSRGESAELAL